VVRSLINCCNFIAKILDPTGALAAGLSPEYVNKLKSIETYRPPLWLMKAREQRKPLSEYPAISAEEMSKHNKKENAW
jgi:hypothetical protein